MLTITTNLSSLNAQRNLNTSKADLSQSLERLSSGLRINSARDDSAGLAISTGLISQSTSLDVGSRNVNDGISLLQTADGAMSQISDMLQRMYTLAVAANNGTLASYQVSSIDKEISALQDQIYDVVQNTDFNGNKLMSSAAIHSFDIRTSNDNTLTVQVSGYQDVVNTIGHLVPLYNNPMGSIPDAIEGFRNLLDTVNSSRAKIGAFINRLGYVGQLNDVTSNNLKTANSQIQDADFATETAALTRNNILQQAGTAILSQANAIPQVVLSLLR